MPLAFLAMAQGVIVVSGGIDLSVGAMMVLANCLSALWMEDQDLAACLAFAVLVLVVTVALSTLTGLIITASGVPDIIVTLAASFFLAGLALFIVGGPGGGTSQDFQRFVAGSLTNPWPSVLWVVGALARRVAAAQAQPTRPGHLRRRQQPHGRLPVRCAHRPTRVLAYSIGGLFAGFAGLVVTASTGGRRATGDDRRQRHAEQRRRRRARRRGADRRRRRARRTGARRGVPHADPGDHARPRLGPEQRRDGAWGDHHPRRARRRAVADTGGGRR